MAFLSTIHTLKMIIIMIVVYFYTIFMAPK